MVVKKKLICRYDRVRTEIREVPEYDEFVISVLIKSRGEVPDIGSVMTSIRRCSFKGGYNKMVDMAEEVLNNLYNDFAEYYGLYYIGVRISPQRSKKFGVEIVWKPDDEEDDEKEGDKE